MGQICGIPENINTFTTTDHTNFDLTRPTVTLTQAPKNSIQHLL